MEWHGLWPKHATPVATVSECGYLICLSFEYSRSLFFKVFTFLFSFLLAHSGLEQIKMRSDTVILD